MRSHSTLLLNGISSAGNLTMSVGGTGQVVPAILRYLFAERSQCQKGHLEMLQAERDADDGDAADKSEDSMHYCDFHTS